MSFAANMAFFGALQRVRECLLQLSAEGYTASRVRMHNGNAVIEIEQPMNVGEVQIKGEHAAIEYCGCMVVWRKPETDEGNGDEC